MPNDDRPAFRPDVEGLRAVAIAAVLLCHAGVPAAAGGYVGVDVFFVISGFLITGLLVRELERDGRVSLSRFYARRARRILPAATLVLAAVVVGSALLFTPVRNDVVAGDVVGAAGFFVNWLYAAQAVDYFQPGLADSPVQHYWSLAIEEQFYLVWPALIIGASWWSLRSGRGLRPALWALVAVVGLASLAYSVGYTGEQPAAAYFSTLTRAWELALGAAIALAPAILMPRAASAALALAGAGAIVYAVATFSGATAFPGAAALVPTLGTAALIVAGRGERSLPVRVLGARPLRHVGRISYAWYLWHWPALVFAAAAWGPLSVGEGLAVAAASWAPAYATHRLVEQPLRFSELLTRRPGRTIAIGATACAATCMAAFALVTAQPGIATAPAAEVRGAGALGDQPDPQKTASALRSNPRDAGEDRSQMQDDGCFLEPPDVELRECAYGDRGSGTTAVLLGDSHAMQFFDPLEAIAAKRGWRLVAMGKGGCTPAATSVYNGVLDRAYRECDEWRERALERIEEMRPELVVLSTSTGPQPVVGGELLGGKERVETLESAFAETIGRVSATGAEVAVIKDLPRAPRHMADCVSGSLERLDACAFERPQRHDKEAFDRRAAEHAPGARLIDLTPEVCPEGLCRAVIGDVLVYRDQDHLTSTYATSLVPWIERGLPEVGR